MFISYDFLKSIKDKPELLQKFVSLHNQCEEADGDYVTIIQDFFDDYARESDYDAVNYDEIMNNITEADKAYDDFEREVRRYLAEE